MIDEKKLLDDLDKFQKWYLTDKNDIPVSIIEVQDVKKIINNQPQVLPIVRTVEDFDGYYFNCYDGDCPCSTYNQCKKEALPDDNLSDICRKHIAEWLTKKNMNK